MIGNDVVDLQDAELCPERRHRRFDRRVFTAGERAALSRSGAPERLRWMFWAAKEAAFKAARRLCPSTVFSPSRFGVALNSNLRGEVRHGDERFSLRVCCDAQHVHAVALAAGFDHRGVVAGVQRIPESLRARDVSEATRRFAADSLARTLGRPIDSLAIVRDRRVPSLLLRGEIPPLDLSLSHHGRFVAFACWRGAAPVGIREVA